MKQSLQLHVLKKGVRMLPVYFIAVLAASCVDKKAQHTAHSEPDQAQSLVSNASPAFGFSNQNLQLFFEKYLDLKAALVDANFENSKGSAVALKESADIGLPAVRQILDRLASAAELAEQRQIFSELNIALEPLLGAQLTSGTLYKQYCPMAFNNTGGFWFSDNSEIINPYFGASMLHCGSIAQEYVAQSN